MTMAQRSCLRQCLSILFVVVVLAPSASLASTYRDALNKYWTKELKEAGVAPLFYASTEFAPKSVWVKKGPRLDYFGSGLDLLPDSLVPVSVAAIVLPTQSSDAETKVSVALQLSGVKEIGDNELKFLRDSGLKWDIKYENAEMHFFAIRDARRTTRRLTSSVLADYLSEKQGGETLMQVVKAVHVSGAEIGVDAKTSSGVAISAEVVAALKSLGFSFDSKRNRHYRLASTKSMYYAIGLRELSSDGLKSAVVGAAPISEPVIAPTSWSGD